MSPGTAQISPRPPPINAAAIDPVCAIRPNSTKFDYLTTTTQAGVFCPGSHDHSEADRRRYAVRQGQRLPPAGLAQPEPQNHPGRLSCPVRLGLGAANPCPGSRLADSHSDHICAPAPPLDDEAAASGLIRATAVLCPDFLQWCRVPGYSEAAGRQVSISSALRPLAAVCTPDLLPW